MLLQRRRATLKLQLSLLAVREAQECSQRGEDDQGIWTTVNQLLMRYHTEWCPLAFADEI